MDFWRQREESGRFSDHFQPHFPPWKRPVWGERKKWKEEKSTKGLQEWLRCLRTTFSFFRRQSENERRTKAPQTEFWFQNYYYKLTFKVKCRSGILISGNLNELLQRSFYLSERAAFFLWQMSNDIDAVLCCNLMSLLLSYRMFLSVLFFCPDMHNIMCSRPWKEAVHVQQTKWSSSQPNDHLFFSIYLNGQLGKM